MVSQPIQVERAPETQLRTEQSTLLQRNNSLGSISTQLGVLQNRVAVLKDPTLFDTRLATSSSATAATATAANGTAIGNYTFAVDHLATVASQVGKSDVGAALSSTDDVSGLALKDAGFATAVTGGIFTVNGKQVTIATTDSLKDVFTKINTATGGDVTASYNSKNDAISLTSKSGSIVLGSTTDSSNFLEQSKLVNNGGGTVTSSSKLGAVKTTGTLLQANFATPLTGGGSGQFKINGVAINYDTSKDSVANVLSRINDSQAGVVASYDPTNDRFNLTNKSTGDVGLSMEDVSGNFLASSGLAAGSLNRGNNLVYTVNGGGQLTSRSNTITGQNSGITGLSVTALTAGNSTISVGSDTATIKNAITGLVTEYNKAQSMINSETASSTDAQGVVTAGVLASDTNTNEINSRLRDWMTSDVTGGSSLLQRLDSLGFSSNGKDDSLSTSDTSKLDDALANNLSGLKDMFTNSTGGLAVKLDSYLTGVIGDSGSLVAYQKSLTKQSAVIDTQVSDMERIIADHQQSLTASFIAMETAQATISQQKAYLTQTFGSGSSTG